MVVRSIRSAASGATKEPVLVNMVFTFVADVVFKAPIQIRLEQPLTKPYIPSPNAVSNAGRDFKLEQPRKIEENVLHDDTSINGKDVSPEQPHQVPPSDVAIDVSINGKDVRLEQSFHVLAKALLAAECNDVSIAGKAPAILKHPFHVLSKIEQADVSINGKDVSPEH